MDSAPDGDLDDAADTLVIHDTFTGTSKTFAYDYAGNLAQDDRHYYEYDAWNRLILVQRIAPDAVSGTDTTTLHTAEYDALGRRIEKVVTNSGDLDGTLRYWYNGQQLIETRDGSGNVLMQAYYGTQYIDEPVALKLEHGYCTVSQDANYNVTTLTDLAGRVLERVFYTEYGQPIIESESYFGDYDGDGDVDATDDAALGSGQTCWGTPTGACRVFDFNQDGTLDAADETIMTALVSAPTTNRIHHARRTSPAGNLFLHQGLVYDAEIGAYQNRAREYSPALSLFAQRAPDGYTDGLHAYFVVRRSPFVFVDWNGLSATREPFDRPPIPMPPPPAPPVVAPPPVVPEPIPAPGFLARCLSCFESGTAGVIGACFWFLGPGASACGSAEEAACEAEMAKWGRRPFGDPPPPPPPPKCLPCQPPVGTKGYRIDWSGPAHAGIPTPHTHHFEVHQSPPSAGCVCFWHETDKHPTGGPSPRPGEVPMTGRPGGGGVAP